MKARWISSNPGRGWAVLLFLALMTPLATARAETVWTPRVSARAEYDDNIRFAREDPEDDLVLSLSPSLTLTHRTERLHTDATASVRALRYLEESDLSREEFRLESTATYGLLERLSLNGDVSFRQDSALESELEETGLVTEQVDRMRMSGGGGLTFRLTELQELGGSFSLSRTTYDSDGFLDYDTAYASLTWTRSLRNQRDSLTLQPYWSSNRSDVSEVATLGLMVGWTRMLTENWRLSAFVGGRRTQTEYQRVEQIVVFDPSRLPRFPFYLDQRIVTQEETSWGGVADVSTEWTGETWAFSAAYNRDLSYSSQGEPIERDRLNLSMRRKLDERLSMQCRGTALVSQYDGEYSQEDTRHFSLAPSLSYRLTERHRLSAGFAYSYQIDELTEDSDRDRKRFWVSLDCTFPQPW